MQVIEKAAKSYPKAVPTPEQLPSTGIDKALAARAEAAFNREWYETTYKPQLHADRLPGETAFAYYMRAGGRAGHDPNPQFSEVIYRQNNRDVMMHLVRAKSMFGFLHWLQFGSTEPQRMPSDRQLFGRIRELVKGIDPGFVSREYQIGQDQFPHPIDFYFANVRTDQLSPSAEFSEEGYLVLNPDIAASIKSGELLCGYDHFLKTRGMEKRKLISRQDFRNYCERERKRNETDFRHKVLNDNLPGIGHLAAFDMIRAMEYYSDPVQVELTAAEEPGGLLVLVPHYLPEIVFGGYLAFFDYLEALKRRTGLKLKLCVVNHVAPEVHCSNLIRMRTEQPRLFHLFDEIGKFDNEQRLVRLPGNFSVISYSAELHYIARSISDVTGRLPIFFIQEYEPDFHANTDMHSFIANAFLIPHAAIYNSAKLFEFFDKKTKVVARQGKGYPYAIFENAIRTLPKDAYQNISLRAQQRLKRLIFYGRPEAHAARNHFAMFVCGLKTAIRAGVFSDNTWEFLSIGSLSHEGKIDLDGRHRLHIKSKLPKDEYEALLLSGDVGVSFITSPHPGIIHFQMAAFGLPTVTNTTELRTQEWLTEQNGNLIGVEMTPDSIVEGLRRAVQAATQADRRWANACQAHTVSKEEAYGHALTFLEMLVSQ